MKILVTGGAGFIGTHIVKQLLQAGHEVVVYDKERRENREEKQENLLPPHSSLLTTIQGDIRPACNASRSDAGRDSKLLTESLKGVDGVIHMASYIAVEESVKDPLKYMENNVLGIASLLTAMREAGVKKIVLSSSATVYGEPKSLPILEDAPLSAVNPYAASKIAMEAIAESFYKTDGFDVTVLRYFNPYGPGENHSPETHAIPNFIKAGLEKRPIPLYWNGEQVRDFIYVEDLAEAHIKVLGDIGDGGNKRDEGKYEIFNVGSESGTRIIDVVNILSEILGYSLNIEDLGERPGDVMANYASSKKLKEETGWEAKFGLEEGLRKTVEWFRGR